MKKAVPVLFVAAFLLNSCFLDAWFGVETVEPEALYTITMGPPPTGTPTITPTVDPDFTPSPVPTRGAGSSQVSPVDGMRMIYIPAEPFLMGGGVESDEVPVHTVSLDAYWIIGDVDGLRQVAVSAWGRPSCPGDLGGGPGLLPMGGKAFAHRGGMGKSGPGRAGRDDVPLGRPAAGVRDGSAKRGHVL